MPVYDLTTAPRARRYALLAILTTSLLCVLSQIGINFNRQTVTFMFVPTLAIYLWPTGANSVISILGIFALGLLQDYLSYGPTGLWAVTWLSLFLLFRPDLREKTVSMLAQFIGAAIVLLCVGVFQIGLSTFILNSRIDIKVMGLSVLLTLLIFPLFYVVREAGVQLFGNRNNFYYERPAR